MSRFLGTVNTRLGIADTPFKNAKVFDTPGCHTFTIPSTANKAKVYVVGAGSTYCAGRYCASSSGCWSGVAFPVCDYSFDFCGHLTGAGGGYAEKTYTSGVGGASINVNVASPTITTLGSFTNGSTIITLRGEYAGAVAVGTSITSSYITGTVSAVNNVSATTTASTTASSTSITVTSATDIYIGSTVTGPGIPFDTYVTDVSGTTITLSNAVTQTLAAGNFVFTAVRVTTSNTSSSTAYASLTITGVTSSSVSGGLATVSASSGTNVALTYDCTSACTARNGSLDNTISLGFQLPVCGYCIKYDGWYNVPGSGSGGDVNHSGGAGVMIPEFVSSTTCLDQSITSGSSSSSYWYNPSITCSCVSSYSSTFGGVCADYPYWNNTCLCYYMCAGYITNCVSAGSRLFYKIIDSSSTLQKETSLGIVSSGSVNAALQNKPYGLGASAGSSSGNGERGLQPGTIYESNTSVCNTGTYIGPASPSGCVYSCTCAVTSGYDYSFGGYWCLNVCNCFHPGCAAGICGLSTATNTCYIPAGYLCCYHPNFGSARSWGYAQYYACIPVPYAPSTGGGSLYKCMSLSYNNEEIVSRKNGSNQIKLSNLQNYDNTNINDIEYATGANSNAAKFGGGGNRLNPSGGSGLVVILYN